MIQFITTSELKATKNGLVDFLADGYIVRDGEKIPCQIGYTQFGEEEPEATHIFIKNGITENGTHYNAETIEL